LTARIAQAVASRKLALDRLAGFTAVALMLATPVRQPEIY
jgi:hypothetical protein